MTSVSAKSRLLEFSDLRSWEADDHSAALDVFQNTCVDLKDPEWAKLCALATSLPDPKAFFELFFKPVLISDGSPALFTGYYEPELQGSLTRAGPYRYPLYRKPPEVEEDTIWFSRQEIEDKNLLTNRGLAIAYVTDPVDVFFLQIQGSGRVRLPDGEVIRVGYGGRNGHEYKSIGKELIRRGILNETNASAQSIRSWVRKNPIDGRVLLQHNPSYVFFREVSEVPAEKGPLGAMNRSITDMRTIAVDPDYTPLGAPVWIEKQGADPINRLMVAQDTGSAIKGKQRADIFYGTGEEAGRAAGRIKDPGRMVVLLPLQLAYDVVPEN
ncbi:murein transglycosylase A [Litoreibacter roseus]|nr:MltA domain-containing protein [Litoreibacter roseus]